MKKILCAMMALAMVACGVSGENLFDSLPCQDAGSSNPPVDAGKVCLEFRYEKIEPNCAIVPKGWTCTHSTDLCFCCED